MQVILHEGDNLSPISEDKNIFTEYSLRQSQKMETLGILASGIAHDFNNILTTIIGYTELSLSEVPTESRVKQNLKQILQAGRRAKELVNEILRFKREISKDKKIIPIVPVIKDVYNQLQVSLPANIKMEMQMEKRDYLIRANPIHIYRILMNLCLNGIQAIEDKGGLLEIKVSSFNLDATMAGEYEELRPGLYLCIAVRDTGKGIPPDIITRIFDPYFTTKREGEGNGLGLSIVRYLVKSYKGKIAVSSEPGKGSTFQIFLPVVNHEDCKDEFT